MATQTYLPPPIKAEDYRSGRGPDQILWAGCATALGILSYYAPKTFLATSVGILFYQVSSFNQLVQKADRTKHQQIHTWAIKACMVMWSVGTVFFIKSLPYFWSAVKDLRQLHLVHGVGHFTKGFLMLAIMGGSSTFFYKSAKDLASRNWVEMEDYVKTYPKDVKQNILSSRTEQIAFYICALLPETGVASFVSRHVSKYEVILNQFRSEKNKVFFLKRCFGLTQFSLKTQHLLKPDFEQTQKDWPFAIHLFQQLSIESQIELGPQLHTLSTKFNDTQRNAFPDDVKAVILNNGLKFFLRIPYEHESDYPQWEAFVTAFEKLPREEQSILGEEFLRLIQTKQSHSISSFFSETMRLAALKAWARTSDILRDLAMSIFDGLTDPFKKEFGLFLQGLLDTRRLKIDELPGPMLNVLPPVLSL